MQWNTDTSAIFKAEKTVLDRLWPHLGKFTQEDIKVFKESDIQDAINNLVFYVSSSHASRAVRFSLESALILVLKFYGGYTGNYDAFDIFSKFREHVKKSRTDKYTQSALFRTVDFIYSEHGKNFNIGNALKYLTRFSATSGEKTGLESDLVKAAHYMLFEISRNLLSLNEEQAD